MSEKLYEVTFQRDDDRVYASVRASNQSQAKEKIKARHYTSSVKTFKIISVVEK